MADTDRNKELAALKKDLTKLQAEVKKLTDDGAKAATQAAADASDALPSALERLEAEVRKFIDDQKSAAGSAAMSGEHAVKNVQDTIQERPLVSAAASLGIGFVLGMLTNRRG